MGNYDQTMPFYSFQILFRVYMGSKCRFYASRNHCMKTLWVLIIENIREWSFYQLI